MTIAVAAFDATWATLPIYLQRALDPVREFLAQKDVVEISINGPFGIWVERLGSVAMEFHKSPQLTANAIRFLAQQVASETHQEVSAEKPILSAALPMGERFQAVIAPAAPSGGAISIRKQVVRRLSLDELDQSGSFDRVRVAKAGQLTEAEEKLCELLDQGKVKEFLSSAVRERVSIAVSGGTSTGKTLFLNALLREVPEEERLVLLEDTQELDPPHENVASLVASKGGQGQADVTIQHLLEAALRMRPDRLFVGEVRGKEAYSFLQAINTGHPGSMTTVHANSAEQAYDRLALATMEAGFGLKKAEAIEYIRSVIPIVVQLSRVNGKRAVSEVYYEKLAKKKRVE